MTVEPKGKKLWKGPERILDFAIVCQNSSTLLSCESIQSVNGGAWPCSSKTLFTSFIGQVRAAGVPQAGICRHLSLARLARTQAWPGSQHVGRTVLGRRRGGGAPGGKNRRAWRSRGGGCCRSGDADGVGVNAAAVRSEPQGVEWAGAGGLPCVLWEGGACWVGVGGQR